MRRKNDIPLPGPYLRVSVKEQRDKLKSGDFNRVIEYLRWQMKPPFNLNGSSGRSPAMERRPRKSESPATPLWKIKGCGASNHVMTATRPSAEPYGFRGGKRTIPMMFHTCVNVQGEIDIEMEELKPNGGINPERGEREYKAAKRLEEHGVRTILPMMWGIYPEILWEGEPIEWVVLGIPAEKDTRLGRDGFRLTDMRTNTVSPLLQEIHGDEGIVETPKDVLKVTSAITHRIGKLLKECHDAGVLNLHMHLDNVGVSDENNFIAHDLDTATMEEEIPAKHLGAYRLVDIDRALGPVLSQLGFMYITHHPDASIELLREHNPLVELLEGYTGIQLDHLKNDPLFTKSVWGLMQRTPLVREWSDAYQKWVKNRANLSERHIPAVYEALASSGIQFPFDKAATTKQWEETELKRDKIHGEEVKKMKKGRKRGKR